jgi:hypothetical protein
MEHDGVHAETAAAGCPALTVLVLEEAWRRHPGVAAVVALEEAGRLDTQEEAIGLRRICQMRSTDRPDSSGNLTGRSS